MSVSCYMDKYHTAKTEVRSLLLLLKSGIPLSRTDTQNYRRPCSSSLSTSTPATTAASDRHSNAAAYA